MKNRLKLLRAERDWSQAALAAQLGVSRQTVNSIERGKYDPSLPLALKIAAVFGQPIEEIFAPDGEQPPCVSPHSPRPEGPRANLDIRGA